MGKILPCIILLLLLSPFSLRAEEDSLINTGVPTLPSTLTPGAVILMPDGGQSVILETLPNGDFMTDLGISISPEGIIRDGEFKGKLITLDPELITPKSPDLFVPPQGTIPKAEIPKNIKPPQKTPVSPLEPKTPEKIQPRAASPKVKTPSPKAASEEEKALTLAQMLPLTRIDQTKPAEPQKEPEKKKAQTPEKKKVQEPAKTVPQPEKKPQAQPKAQPAKQKAGEALRIPPDAAKTGNLSFLEGCWQGTRPEYYSKRTIRECFCFGANGGNGKRRIFDGPKRMCIGATKAKLSSNGVLSVTSSGAACNDGEKWGSAEMVCRNSGPRTPCSWVFTDANNGRQSYEIPFVRVDSCGR